MTEFVFNDIKIEDVLNMEKNSMVFNMSRDRILQERVNITSFSDDRLGSSTEHIDIALLKDGKWCILDIQDKIKDYNSLPLEYLIGNEDFSMVMVIKRAMSSVITDTRNESIYSSIYNVVCDKYKDIDRNISIMGKLAKYRIILDGSDKMYKEIYEIEGNSMDMSITNWLNSIKE